MTTMKSPPGGLLGLPEKPDFAGERFIERAYLVDGERRIVRIYNCIIPEDKTKNLSKMYARARLKNLTVTHTFTEKGYKRVFVEMMLEP